MLDTDTLSLIERGHPVVIARVRAEPVSDVEVSAITIQEQVQGWLNPVNRSTDPARIALAYDRLVTRSLPVWRAFSVVTFSVTAIARFDQLRSFRLNVGAMDLRIAAVALENGLIVVTRNRRDFGRVPGLPLVDWSV